MRPLKKQSEAAKKYLENKKQLDEIEALKKRYENERTDIAIVNIDNYDEIFQKLDDGESQMLQSTFMFVPAENGGYVNQGIRRLVYGDEWSVIKTR